jgi:hypothetical protein
MPSMCFEFQRSLERHLNPILILRLLDHAALLAELGSLLRRLELADIMPAVRVIGCPIEHRQHLLGDPGANERLRFAVA